MNKTRLFLLSGISLFALSTAANATLQEAVDAIKDKDYVFAVQELNRLVKDDNNTKRLLSGQRRRQKPCGSVPLV